MFYKETEGFSKISSLARSNQPFLFFISYDKQQVFVERLESLGTDIFFKIGTYQRYPQQKSVAVLKSIQKNTIPFTEYRHTFDKVIHEIEAGNTYLLNLTFQTQVETEFTLQEIFTHSDAKFKLCFKEQFVCFSPEPFIEIQNNQIYTYPMKGTIDASLPEAETRILTNPKETAEHIMIVDLMRNDLSIVAKNVKVEQFRYVEEITAGEKKLLQVSSKISGDLPGNWRHNLGEILSAMLPAGSISGTPKRKTVEIIHTIENYERGFYTGIFGIVDKDQLFSSVMIRFLEQKENQLFYKSGGGITLDSNVREEYQELIDKIYLPI